MAKHWLEELSWTPEGLIPVIVVDDASGLVLMQAWMNRESLQLTVQGGHTVFWSRSRQQLWHKGEQSGHRQIVKEIRVDCDNDTLLVRVQQQGGIACHTGRQSCFFRKLEDDGWVTVEPVIKDPRDIYPKSVD